MSGALSAIPRLVTLVGLAVAGIGFGLICLAWGKTAGLDEVSRQLPWVLSAGGLGLALVAIGAVAVSLDAKAADSRARLAQMAELHDLLAELRDVNGR